MSFFDLDPVASANIIDQARANPIKPEDLSAGVFSGTLKAPFTGAAASINGAAMLAADAATPFLKATIGKPIDQLFGGTNVQDFLEGQRRNTHQAAVDLTPDPMTSGVVAQTVHGLMEIAPQFVAGSVMGGPAGGAVLVGGIQANKRMQTEADKGVDPVTAMELGAIEGVTQGVGALLPMHVGPTLTSALSPAARVAASLAFGSSVQTTTGIATRAANAAVLENNGYADMAKQYEPFDKSAILFDVILGAAFGGLGHAMSAKVKPNEITPNDVNFALAGNEVRHLEIDTTPGMPASPEARQVHVESINKALADLMGGDPVDVGAKASLVDFLENPHQTQVRSDIGSAVSAHLDLPTLDANLASAEGKTPITVPGAILGNETSVKIENQYQPVRWAVVDAANLEATMSKADNQFRDRMRAASTAQVSKIANAPDFNLLASSPIMDFGAPTLTSEGLIVGGNGRFAGLSKAYDQGTHEGYSKPLASNLEKYGIDPNAAAGMQKPVLVRILEKKVDVQRAAMASNEGAGLRMSALEQAKVDAVRLGDITGLHVSDNGEILSGPNHDYIRRWAMAMPDTERASLVDKAGHLSQEGKTRLRNAVLHRAYGDSATLERVVESADPGARNVVAALVKTAANVAEVKAAIEAGNLYPLDISNDIASAVETLDRVRSQGMKISDYLNQGEMFGSELTPEARKIMQFMGENLRSAKAMGDMINAYYDRVKASGDPKQGDMLGGGAPGKMELLDASIADTGKTLTPGMAELPFEGEIAKDDIGAQLMARVSNDFEGLKKEYDSLEDSKGGTVLNTDVARELSPGYLKDRTRSADVHEAASAFIKKLYAEKLAQATPEGKDPIVTFTAGGTGAGKTTGLELLGTAGSRFEMIYDTNMNTLASAEQKINQALDAGRAVTILYTFRDPVEAFQNGALTRATRQEAQFGTGRTVPIPEHIKTHVGSRDVMAQLAAKYANDDRVNMIAVDNSRGKGNAAVVPLESLPKIEQNGLREKLNETLNKELQAGRISEATAKGFSEPGRPQGAQSEVRPGSAIQSEQRAQPQSGAGGEQQQPDLYSVNQLIADRPNLTIPNEEGSPILARDALAQADENIATAKRESQAYDAAVACALRG